MAVMVKLFLLAVFTLLVAEIAVFIAVGAAIGLPQAFLLLAATSFAGVAVLRHPGRTRIARLHEAVAKNGIGGLEAGGDAFLTIAAGVLLLVPGFITDAAGLLLLLPPVRRWIGGRFQQVVNTQTQPPGVVDLEPDQWNQVPERQIDDQRRPNGTP
jgi:UPF0716 protein FxsA